MKTTVAACLVGIAVSSYCAIKASSQANNERLLRQRADAQAALAEQRREEADSHAKLAQRRRHFSNRHLAQVAWQNGSLGHIVQLLEQHGPKTHSDRDLQCRSLATPDETNGCRQAGWFSQGDLRDCLTVMTFDSRDFNHE